MVDSYWILQSSRESDVCHQIKLFQLSTLQVIGNVYNRVGQIFYGFVRPPLRIDRRQGKPRNQHNAELCQACKEGLCKEEWSFSWAKCPVIGPNVQGRESFLCSVAWWLHTFISFVAWKPNTKNGLLFKHLMNSDPKFIF